MNKKIRSVPPPLAPRPLRLKVDAPTAEDVRIEVVPLIDVIFCILIFFILAAVSFSRQQAISVNLPKASTGTPQGREILVVGLNELGEVQVEQQPVVTKDQFIERLKAYRQQSPDGVMALYASPNASYNDVVQVLDLLRQVGGDRVALATFPDDGSTSGTKPLQPPATGVPGFTPNPGTNPVNPYGTQTPATPFDPTQPQLPVNPGQSQPGVPGTSPGISLPSPGQPGVSPGNSTVPAPGTTTTPRTNNTAPGNSGGQTSGTTTTPTTNDAAPGNSGGQTSGTTTTPTTNDAAPKR